MSNVRDDCGETIYLDAIERTLQVTRMPDLRWKGGKLQQRHEVVQLQDGKPHGFVVNDWVEVPTVD